MEDPIKIIHKYKNNNRRIQYQIHIFIGDIVDSDCMKILQKIKTMDFYTTLVSLDDRERGVLEKNYGEYWYEKFFNSYHINNIKETIPKNPAKMKELETLYPKEWITEHFLNYLKRIQVTTYNYEYAVKEERERRMIKKIMQKQQHETEELLDYTTVGAKSGMDASRISEAKVRVSGEKVRVSGEKVSKGQSEEISDSETESKI